MFKITGVLTKPDVIIDKAHALQEEVKHSQRPEIKVTEASSMVMNGSSQHTDPSIPRPHIVDVDVAEKAK